MNRKLHNSLLAFSASGLMLVLGLMVASPASQGLARVAPSEATTSARHAMAALASDAESAGLDITQAGADELAVRIDARARALQAELDGNTDAGDQLASVIAFAAEVSTDATLLAALGKATADHSPRQAEKTEEARHERRFRSAVAVPYFSFAQRLRGSRS